MSNKEEKRINEQKNISKENPDFQRDLSNKDKEEKKCENCQNMQPGGLVRLSLDMKSCMVCGRELFPQEKKESGKKLYKCKNYFHLAIPCEDCEEVNVLSSFEQGVLAGKKEAVEEIYKVLLLDGSHNTAITRHYVEIHFADLLTKYKENNNLI